MTALPTADCHVVLSTPYPWPWNGDLAGPGTAVAVVVPRDGWPAVPAACAEAVRSVVAAVAAAGGAVIAISTAAPGRGADAALGPGARGPGELIQDHLGIASTGIDAVVLADGIDGFSGSSLEGALHARSVSRLVLVGAGLETCIHSTMRSANDRGFECLLVVDASAPYDPSLVPASISMIEMSGGIFGAVAASADVIRAFLNPGA